MAIVAICEAATILILLGLVVFVVTQRARRERELLDRIQDPGAVSARREAESVEQAPRVLRPAHEPSAAEAAGEVDAMLAERFR